MNRKKKIVSLNVLTFTEVMTKIVSHFSHSSEAKTSRNNKSYYHVDIELMWGDKYCSIRITNCGAVASSLSQLFTLKFDGVAVTGEISSVVTLKESESDVVQLYETSFNGDFTKLKADPNAIVVTKFSHLKEYLSLEPRCKLTTRQASEFIKYFVEKLSQLTSIHPQTKYTFHSGDEKFFNNPVDLDNDYIHCESLSSAIAQVLKQSVNDEFRKRAFELLNIESADEAFNVTMQHLLPLINKNYQL